MQIGFISHDGQNESARALFSKLLEPILQLIETLLRCGIVDQDRHCRVSVIHSNEGSVNLRAGCVPDVKSDLMIRAWRLDDTRGEVGADCGLRVLTEIVVDEPLDDTSLPDAGLSEEHQLDWF